MNEQRHLISNGLSRSPPLSGGGYSPLWVVSRLAARISGFQLPSVRFRPEADIGTWFKRAASAAHC
jgi:hypothetical protein